MTTSQQPWCLSTCRCLAVITASLQEDSYWASDTPVKCLSLLWCCHVDTVCSQLFKNSKAQNCSVWATASPGPHTHVVKRDTHSLFSDHTLICFCCFSEVTMVTVWVGEWLCKAFCPRHESYNMKTVCVPSSFFFFCHNTEGPEMTLLLHVSPGQPVIIRRRCSSHFRLELQLIFDFILHEWPVWIN